MVQPIVAPPVPSNATLPTQSTPRPVEQERDQGVRGDAPEAVTTAQQNDGAAAQDSRSGQIQAAASRETGEARPAPPPEGRGASIDLIA